MAEKRSTHAYWRRLLVVGALVLLCSVCVDAKQEKRRDESWGRPIVALTHWSLYDIHPAGPFLDFVMYAGGRVLYVASGSDMSSDDYRMVRLTPAEQRALLGDLSLNQVGSFHLRPSRGDDGATTCLTVWSHGGRDRRHECLWEPETQVGVPPKLMKMLNRLGSYSSPRAKRWIPPRVKVSVRLEAPEYCRPTASDWPKDWPVPSVEEEQSKAWTFVGNGKMLNQLRRDECWVLHGQHYLVSHSVVFPHQEQWVRPPDPDDPL